MLKNVHEWNSTQDQHNAMHTHYLDWFVSNFSTWSYQFSFKESSRSREETRICRRQNWMKWIKDRCPEEITLSWQPPFLYYVFKSNFMCNLITPITSWIRQICTWYLISNRRYLEWAGKHYFPGKLLCNSRLAFTISHGWFHPLQQIFIGQNLLLSRHYTRCCVGWIHRR